MAKDNYPNIQKCLLSAPAELISLVDTYVPDTDTIIEDQWAPVVGVCRGGGLFDWLVVVVLMIYCICVYILIRIY